jgi:hypothetical protein
MQISKHREASAFVKVAEGPQLKSPASPGMTVPQQIALMAAPMLVGKAIDMGIAAVSRVRDAANKGRSFKEMLEVNPHLQGGDSITVQRYFNTLHRMNPELASDPIVAGSFVSNQLGLHTPNRPHAGMFDAAKSLSSMRGGGGGMGGPTTGSMITRYLMDAQGAASKDVVGGLQGELKETQGKLRDTEKRRQVTLAYAKRMKGQAQNSGEYFNYAGPGAGDYARQPGR